MQKVMRILLKTCKKTAELIDKQMLISLTLKEKVQLKAHKSICRNCKAYEKQSKLVDVLISKHFADSYNKHANLDEEKKFQIIEALWKI